jgi:hypothetical protein
MEIFLLKNKRHATSGAAEDFYFGGKCDVMQRSNDLLRCSALRKVEQTWLLHWMARQRW